MDHAQAKLKEVLICNHTQKKGGVDLHDTLSVVSFGFSYPINQVWLFCFVLQLNGKLRRVIWSMSLFDP